MNKETLYIIGGALIAGFALYYVFARPKPQSQQPGGLLNDVLNLLTPPPSDAPYNNSGDNFN